jgi:beta-galactosidase
VLEAAKVRDLAWVHVDGKQVGTMDTRHRRFSVDLPARSKPACSRSCCTRSRA